MKLNVLLQTPASAWNRVFPAAAARRELSAICKAAYKETVLATCPKKLELGIMLASDPAMKELNHTYRGKNKATNVLSFPAYNTVTEILASHPESKACYLGDIVLAYETIAREAKAQKKTIRNHATHLIVHGCLHLIGYDHLADGEAEAMEALEMSILKQLHIPNPYI